MIIGPPPKFNGTRDILTSSVSRTGVPAGTGVGSGSLTVMISDRGRPWPSLKKAITWTCASGAPVCRSALGCLVSKSSTGSKSLPTVNVIPVVSMTRRICWPSFGHAEVPHPAVCG
jgi:hypothetical protein